MGGLLTLLADPLRARILHSLLLIDEMCVGDLALALGASGNAVSYAPRVLRTAGLIHRRCEGRMGYYRLREGAAQDAFRDSIDRLRHLTSLHLEASADDANES